MSANLLHKIPHTVVEPLYKKHAEVCGYTPNDLSEFEVFIIVSDRLNWAIIKYHECGMYIEATDIDDSYLTSFAESLRQNDIYIVALPDSIKKFRYLGFKEITDVPSAFSKYAAQGECWMMRPRH